MLASRLRIGIVVLAGLSAPACLGQTRVRLGGISVGAGYTRYSGYYWPAFPYAYYPAWYGFYGWYDPFFPLYHPGYYRGFSRGLNMGEVRLRTESKDTEVYLDGAYAGRAGDLKSIWLEPGAYTLAVRAPGTDFSRRIYVLSGKTLRVEAASRPAETEKKP